MPTAPSAEPWIHEIGARRGRYEITAQVARGGYGEVYAVRDEAGGQWAMKLLRLARESDRRAAERAVLEAAFVKRLDHVNVVRYREAFVDADGAVVLVTEFLPGRSLRELVTEEGALPVERALRLGKQLAEAASAVHAMGAVHRDIKPENVFVIPGDIVKLFDFGLVKSTGITLKTTRPVGTPRYMAPDQLTYRPHSGAPPDPRWDVYSIGLVMFEMLAGCHPFDLDPARAPSTAADVIARHLSGTIPHLRDVMPGLPTSLAHTIARAVEKDPGRRLSSAAELATELGVARHAWIVASGDEATGITAELRRISDGAADVVSPSESAATLERVRPALGDAMPPVTVRMVPKVSPPQTGPFGTEPMVPHLDPAALRARRPNTKRKL